MLVKEEQLAPVLKIGVLDADDGLALIGQLLKEDLLYFQEFDALYDPCPFLVILLIDEEVVGPAKIVGEKGVEEGEVVVEATNLEDLLATEARLAVPSLTPGEVLALLVLLAEAPLVPTILDVPKKLQADLVRIQG